MLRTTFGVLRKAGRGPLRLSALQSGREPKVLFVHGATCKATVWVPLMTALSRHGVASLALDLRGHDLSEGEDELQSFTIEDYVEDVLACLRAFPTVRFLVGHSMGGLIAQLVAARVELSGLALIASCPIHGMRKDGLRMFMRHPLTFLRIMRLRSFKSLYADHRVCRSLLFTRNTDPSVIRTFMDGVCEESWIAANQMNTLLPSVRAVSCPVCVFGAEDDGMVSAESINATAAAYGVAARFFRASGHMMQLEVAPRILSTALMEALQINRLRSHYCPTLAHQ